MSGFSCSESRYFGRDRYQRGGVEQFGSKKANKQKVSKKKKKKTFEFKRHQLFFQPPRCTRACELPMFRRAPEVVRRRVRNRPCPGLVTSAAGTDSRAAVVGRTVFLSDWGEGGSGGVRGPGSRPASEIAAVHSRRQDARTDGRPRPLPDDGVRSSVSPFGFVRPRLPFARSFASGPTARGPYDGRALSPSSRGSHSSVGAVPWSTDPVTTPACPARSRATAGRPRTTGCACGCRRVAREYYGFSFGSGPLLRCSVRTVDNAA